MQKKRKAAPDAPLFALFTDFGPETIYTGHLEGVLRAFVPRCRTYTLSHQVPRQNPSAAAFLLRESLPFIPPETYVLCVIDPGVGTDREIVALEVEKPIEETNQSTSYTFVGPNNGMFSFFEDSNFTCKVHQVNPTEHGLDDISKTFHGRDVMAPVIARLAQGYSLRNIGTRTSLASLTKGASLHPDIKEDTIHGSILFTDSFGNAISNIHHSDLTSKITRSQFSECDISLQPTSLKGIKSTYTDVPSGTTLSLIGSFGYLEIAINQGSAETKLNLQEGSPIEVHFS